jgi:hypothetical protein
MSLYWYYKWPTKGVAKAQSEIKVFTFILLLYIVISRFSQMYASLMRRSLLSKYRGNHEAGRVLIFIVGVTISFHHRML